MVNRSDNPQKKGLSLDWLVGGVLTKIGDTFDRVTGRGWNPSSNLATSQLTDKLCKIMDAEVRDFGKEGRFVPHSFALKIQWNKFSTDSDEDLRKLEYELHAAAIDHINDKLYHTYAPLEIRVEKDYFVEGVRFIAGFGDLDRTGEDEVALNVSLTNIPIGEQPREAEEAPLAGPEVPASGSWTLFYEVNGKKKEVSLDPAAGKRFSVGRAPSNDIAIDHASISKSHAVFAFKNDGSFVLADTGSTNGTFIRGNRIAYGKAIALADGDELKFGAVAAKITEQAYPETDVTVADVDVREHDVREEGPVPTEADLSVEVPAPTVAANKQDIVSAPAEEPAPQPEQFKTEAGVVSKEDWEI